MGWYIRKFKSTAKFIAVESRRIEIKFTIDMDILRIELANEFNKIRTAFIDEVTVL